MSQNLLIDSIGALISGFSFIRTHFYKCTFGYFALGVDKAVLDASRAAQRGYANFKQSLSEMSIFISDVYMDVLNLF